MGPVLTFMGPFLTFATTSPVMEKVLAKKGMVNVMLDCYANDPVRVQLPCQLVVALLPSLQLNVDGNLVLLLLVNACCLPHLRLLLPHFWPFGSMLWAIAGSTSASIFSLSITPSPSPSRTQPIYTFSLAHPQ